MTPKTKLHCFKCNRQIRFKKDVWRDKNNYPICRACLWEVLDEFWEYPDDILQQIKKNFDRNFKKWQKHYFETRCICKGEHPEYSEFYVPNEQLCKDGYCGACCDTFMERLGLDLNSKDICKKCRALREREAEEEK